VQGPISSGAIHDHVDDYSADVAEALADEGKEMVHKQLRRVLRNPTGYYESHIDTRPLSSTRYEIHDNDMVYGPWLEGTGSRNSPVTVFPGYRTFRIVEENLKRKRSGIARRILRQHRSRGRLI
jgi:hypothetical protein